MKYYTTSDVASWLKENDVDFMKFLCENSWAHRPERTKDGRLLWEFDDYLLLKEQLLSLPERFNSFEALWGRATPSRRMENPIRRSRFTGKEIKVTSKKKTPDNSYVFWEGPSEHDGVKIVAIVTGLVRRSENEKTGPMSQLYILLADVHPMDAMRSGQDESICGLCSHRGKIIEDFQREKIGFPLREAEGSSAAPERSCYVDPRNITSVWNSYKKGLYKTLPRKKWKEVLERSPFPIRLGSYGDPAMLPIRVLEDIVEAKPEYTGYTALWELDRVQPYKAYLQASVANIQKLYEAMALGWSTYRAAVSTEPPIESEIICPYEPEHWENKGYTDIDESMLWKCDHCLICGGTEGIRQKKRVSRGGEPLHIVDPIHGSRSGYQEKRFGDEGRSLWLPQIYDPENLPKKRGFDV